MGMIVWEMDFKKTFDIIVLPQSFYNQLFSHIQLRELYADPI